MTLITDNSNFVEGSFQQPLEPYGLSGTVTIPISGTYSFNNISGYLEFAYGGTTVIQGYSTAYYIDASGYVVGDNATGDYWLTSYYYEGGSWSLLDDNNPGTWSITRTSVPAKAANPSPSDGNTNQAPTVALSWLNGGGATSYDVYFGTDSTPDSGELKGNQPGRTYDPGTLSYRTTYYWRIDAKNSNGTATGNIWSFTTEGVLVPNVVGQLQSSAESAVTSAGLAVGTETSAYSHTVPAGRVISQNPAAGTSVALGSSVNLVISTGPTIYVDGVGGSDSGGTGAQSSPYKTVQKALEVASNGDMIIILAGSYPENLTMNKAVTIEAQGGLVRVGQ